MISSRNPAYFIGLFCSLIGRNPEGFSSRKFSNYKTFLKVIVVIQRMQIFLFISYNTDSLRNNNISDEGIRKLVEKGVHCECFQKIAYVFSITPLSVRTLLQHKF